MKTSHLSLASVLLAVSLLGACTEKQTIQDVMNKQVDPSADAVWESVGSTLTEKGDEHRQPRTDAEWLAVRGHALTLIEGAQAVAKKRPVGKDADASTPGTRTAAQIRADIDADPARFAAAASVLENSARVALAAIDRRDVSALVLAGEGIDMACESCHAAYWYPRNPYQPLPDAEAFGKIAIRP